MYRFKDVKYKGILDIKSLNINDKKITSIVGESGSGKTTLLRLLNKMISPTSGELNYFSKNINDINSIRLRRDVLMLPQNPEIFKGSIRDNLLIGLRFSKKEILMDSKLKEILKLVKLDKDLDLDAKKLSGGEKQRLALGRIFLLDPKVYLLDEPSSALDEETENIIINELVKHTKEKQKTLIMVTHSSSVASKYSDEIIRLKSGKIIN